MGSREPNVQRPASVSATVLVGEVDPDSYALRYTCVYTVASTRSGSRVQAVGNDSLVVALASAS